MHALFIQNKINGFKSYSRKGEMWQVTWMISDRKVYFKAKMFERAKLKITDNLWIYAFIQQLCEHNDALKSWNKSPNLLSEAPQQRPVPLNTSTFWLLPSSSVVICVANLATCASNGWRSHGGSPTQPRTRLKLKIKCFEFWNKRPSSYLELQWALHTHLK